MSEIRQVKQIQKPRRRRQRGTAPQDFGTALGASRSFEVENRPHGPFAIAALLDEIQNRLVSRGGRPSDPASTIRRLVPIKKQVWRSLKAQAANLSRHGRRISPAQLAAVLVEKSVSQLGSSTTRDRRQD